MANLGLEVPSLPLLKAGRVENAKTASATPKPLPTTPPITPSHTVKSLLTLSRLASAAQ
jgi:hypothetical protein